MHNPVLYTLSCHNLFCLPANLFDVVCAARIYVKSGDGGAGCVSFRREPYVEKGGPNGGNGGRGGHVWAIADPALNSLMTFRHQMHFRAANGTPGQGSQRDGADATDLYVKVPLGTIIRTKDAGEDEPPLAELLEAGQKALLLVGGRGGRGNASFKTGRNTAPAIAEKGEVGREAYVDLELKVWLALYIGLHVKSPGMGSMVYLLCMKHVVWQ